MFKRMKRRRVELDIRYSDLFGSLPMQSPFRWWEFSANRMYLDDLEAEIESIERHELGRESFDSGP